MAKPSRSCKAKLCSEPDAEQRLGDLYHLHAESSTHAVTADYPGDANFAASKSKPVKQVVN